MQQVIKRYLHCLRSIYSRVFSVCSAHTFAFDCYSGGLTQDITQVITPDTMVCDVFDMISIAINHCYQNSKGKFETYHIQYRLWISGGGCEFFLSPFKMSCRIVEDENVFFHLEVFLIFIQFNCYHRNNSLLYLISWCQTLHILIFQVQLTQ